MKEFIVVTISLLIIAVSTFTIYLSSLEISKNKVIKQFKENKELFELAVEELEKEENDIYFKRIGNAILIHIHEYNEDGVNVIKVKENEYEKYSKTIELMEKLNIEEISKSYENIDFLFQSSFAYGKYIVYLNNLEKYTFEHTISEKAQIIDEWYYVETGGAI